MSEVDKITPEEREAIGTLGDDALQVFRTGLFMMVIYISILSLTLRQGGVDFIENIINSLYTLNGVLFWVGSVTIGVYAHRTARRVSLQDQYSHQWAIDDRWVVLNLSTSGIVGLLISIISLIFGLLDGWAHTVNPSAGSLGIEQPILIVGLAVILASATFSMFSTLDMIRDRWGPIRKILRLHKLS